jgi:hypothetical protein
VPHRSSTKAWGRTGPGLVELTLVVTDRNRPVSGLSRADLRLELDGDEVRITALGDSTVAPLHLALAMDLSASMEPHLDELSRQLSRLALRLGETGAEVMLQTSGTDGSEPAAQGETGRARAVTAAELAQALERPGDSETDDLAAMITRAASGLGRGGRSFLLVVTDGGDSASRASWERADAAVDASGAQVLLVGLRSDALDRRARRRLEGLVERTGGRSYILRDTQTLGMVCDYFGDLMDASYALRLPGPSQIDERGLRVTITTPARDLEVHHPQLLRRRGPDR